MWTTAEGIKPTAVATTRKLCSTLIKFTVIASTHIKRDVDKTPRFSLLAMCAMLGIIVFGELLHFTRVAPFVPATSTNIVISQVYGGGGNSGSTYRNDFIELVNHGASSVDVTGWSVQYASAGGTTWQVTTLSGNIAPGHYYLVQEAAGTGGTINLPVPDATGSINMSATAGRVAIVRNSTALTSCTDSSVVDLVGYGSGVSCSEGAAAAPAPSNTTSILRASSGCTDTDNNAQDFSIASPAPHNSSSPVTDCSTTPPPPPPPPASECGVERWSVKTGTDADAGQVNLVPETPTSIATMRSWTAPSSLPANNRIAPYETTNWTVWATLVKFKKEDDSDYHVVITDHDGNTMVTEVAAPLCVGPDSPLFSGITKARSQFDNRLTATSSFQTVNVPVRITGAGFFDFQHGQTGVAPNAIEIHPILDIVFNPAPTLLTEPGTQHAIALDSVTMFRDPFPVATTANFSTDQRTRIMLFISDLELMPTEGPSAVSIQAEDEQHNVYSLTVEYMGKVEKLDWLTEAVVKLPDAVANAQQVWLSVHVRDVVSNRAFINIKPSGSISFLKSGIWKAFAFDSFDDFKVSPNNKPILTATARSEELLLQALASSSLSPLAPPRNFGHSTRPSIIMKHDIHQGY